MLANAGVPLLKLGQKLVAETVAGVGGVAVGGVFAPGLTEAGEVRLDLGACRSEGGAENAAFGELNHRMDAGQAFGPRSAEEFAEDRFRLIVEGVGCGYCIELVCGQQPAKPGVAETAGGFLDGLMMLARFDICIDLMGVELDAQGLCEVSGESLVEIGFFAAQAVVEVGGVQYDAQFRGSRGEGAGERDGIGSAGEADGQAQAGPEQRCVER